MKKDGYLSAVIVAACLLIWYGGAVVLFALIPEFPWWGKLLLCVAPLAVCAMVVYVLVQRVRELKSGETDDLDQY